MTRRQWAKIRRTDKTLRNLPSKPLPAAALLAGGCGGGLPREPEQPPKQAQAKREEK